MKETLSDTATSQDFARLVELQQAFTRDTLALETLEAKMSNSALHAATAHATDYVVLQEQVAVCEAELNDLFTAHPEWRAGDSKSVKTPFGSVEKRASTKLEVPNPAATVALIKVLCDQKVLQPNNYLHITEEPNLEALEAFSDDELSKLGITRVKSEKITVKPAKVTASKVVKAAKKEAA